MESRGRLPDEIGNWRYESWILFTRVLKSGHGRTQLKAFHNADDFMEPWCEGLDDVEGVEHPRNEMTSTYRSHKRRVV